MPELSADIAALRGIIANRDELHRRRFDVLHELACLANGEQHERALQELVLRCLEYRESFDGCGPILDSLVRRVGLFPYLEPERLGIADQIAFELHRPSPDDTTIVFHREQAEVFRSLLAGNSIVLSAPTSFGKSLLVDALVATERYNNVLVVVPTIALIDETRQRLARKFRDKYKIVTHTFQEAASRNLYVLTQERALERLPDDIDLLVIDEFYKLSPSQNADDVRWNLLNQLFYRYVKRGTQFYMLGPSVRGLSNNLNVPLRYETINTPYQTVVSEIHREKGKAADSLSRLVLLCKGLSEPTIIFCSSPDKTATVAAAVVDSGLKVQSEVTKEAADWLALHYNPEWHVVKGIRNGIGVHHARIPRAIAQWIVRAFNSDELRFLACTSTLIEGVNTKARNVVIFDNKINRTPIDFFTFNNIRGRSGRMGTGHFIGHVFLFHDPPEDLLPLVDVPAFEQTEDTPESLLVQLDEDDLTARSRKRLSDIQRSEVLSYETIRANNGIEPRKQIALATMLAENPQDYAAMLSWRRYPTSDQLRDICEIIWSHFDGGRLARQSVRSARQLAFLINRLRVKPTTKELIDQQLEYNHDPDKAIPQVLDFLRLWAQFHFPRLLRVVGRIQAEVLGRLGRPFGDYDFFANQVESLFLDPTLLALEEYGVPLELGRKLEGQLKPDGDLDGVLSRLKAISPDQRGLLSFERRLLRAAQETI